MKKILEVLRFGENDIRFHTDFDPVKNPALLPATTSDVAFSMATRLWGGNERSVLAMLRCLTIADIAMSVNRKQMIHWLEEESAILARSFQEAMAEFQRSGGKVFTFAPGTSPSSEKN